MELCRVSYHEVQPCPESRSADPCLAHLQDVNLAVVALETAGGSAGGEALAVRSQPVHVPVQDVAPKLPGGVVH